MTFTDLKLFLAQKMRMSHIYQSLLIKILLEAGGLATIRQLAREFAANDESQILFYEKRLKEMPIRVLSNHEVIPERRRSGFLKFEHSQTNPGTKSGTSENLQ